ncbi:MAG: hypothetical protein CMP91_11915 [Gammaproteobacteria bacterium]|nr:hypothetical protein [Gammaproteobacteria bacterium]|tara:strand:- start:1776 stop:2312 length:537 start_codon:yes stop_codon:yes gene_type:complete
MDVKGSLSSISANRAILIISVLLLLVALTEYFWPLNLETTIETNTSDSFRSTMPINLAGIVNPDNAYSFIIDAPLFTVNREPYRPPVQEQEAEAVTPVAIAEPQPEETINFSIQGIILSPQTQIALLKLNSTSEVQRVRVGETIEGWEITGIENNQISIRKNADTRIIQLVENTANAN